MTPRAALLRHRDGHAGFGDGIHGGGHEGCSEGDAAGKARLRADLGGDDVGVGGNEEDVVEGQGFGDFRQNHALYCCTAGRIEGYGRLTEKTD